MSELRRLHQVENRKGWKFPKDFAKWAFMAALYDEVAANHLKMGQIIGRELFLKAALPVQTTPEAIAEIALSQHPIGFMRQPLPNPKRLVGLN